MAAPELPPPRQQRPVGVRAPLLALLAATAALGVTALPAMAQTKTVLRISTPAVPDDWHAKMWTVMKDELEKTAPGQFDVQINLNASLFKQGTEPAAMARGNLEMSSISAFDIAKLVPEFSIFTAGYIIRDPDHLMKVFNGPVGNDMFKAISEKMDITVLAPVGHVHLVEALEDLVRVVQVDCELIGLAVVQEDVRCRLGVAELLPVNKDRKSVV